MAVQNQIILRNQGSRCSPLTIASAANQSTRTKGDKLTRPHEVQGAARIDSTFYFELMEAALQECGARRCRSVWSETPLDFFATHCTTVSSFVFSLEVDGDGGWRSVQQHLEVHSNRGSSMARHNRV